MTEQTGTNSGAARLTEWAGLPPLVRLRLRQERASHGWSLRAAGRRLGCSAPMLMRVERGDRIPGPTLAGRIVDVYGLDPAIAGRLQRRVEWLADPNRDPNVPYLDEPEPLRPATVSLVPVHRMDRVGELPVRKPEPDRMFDLDGVPDLG